MWFWGLKFGIATNVLIRLKSLKLRFGMNMRLVWRQSQKKKHGENNSRQKEDWWYTSAPSAPSAPPPWRLRPEINANLSALSNPAAGRLGMEASRTESYALFTCFFVKIGKVIKVIVQSCLVDVVICFILKVFSIGTCERLGAGSVRRSERSSTNRCRMYSHIFQWI